MIEVARWNQQVTSKMYKTRIGVQDKWMLDRQQTSHNDILDSPILAAMSFKSLCNLKLYPAYIGALYTLSKGN
jgi:hypothetical protein